MPTEEKSLWLMVTGEGDDPEPVRILHESSIGGPLEGIMAFTDHGERSKVEVDCREDPEVHAIKVDPVQFCHQMARHFPDVGIDLVFIDDEPHPLTHAGAKHALEMTGDLTWNTLSLSRDVVRESIRRLRRTLTAPGSEENPYFRIYWANGGVTSHPQSVQEQLEMGHNVYANNKLPTDIPQLAEMSLPTNSECSMAPILVETADQALRLFVAESDWVNAIVAHMEYRGLPVVKFWVVGTSNGGVDLLGPV